MAGIYSQGGSAGHRYAGWLETVEAKNFQFGGKVFNGSPSAIYVGSKMVWMGLGYEAMQAILGAFGQTDGMAVIKATNAYLTQLAASDRDKAQQIADWLNAYAEDDARIVISLVPTLGKRWIVGNSTTYLNTGRNMAANGSIEIEFRNGDSGYYPMLIGTNWGDGNGFAVDKQSGNTNTQITIRGFTSSTINTGYTDNLLYLSWTEFTLNGQTVTNTNTAIESGSTVYLGGVRSYDRWTGRIYRYKYKEDGADITNYIPYCKNNVNGWIDLLSGTFYPPTSGTWGIADSYTPSTP